MLPTAIGLTLLLCAAAVAVPVIPIPILEVEAISPYSITIVWELPENEIFDEFVVEVVPEEGDVVDFNPKDMRRTFQNLTPGVLYTFIVRTVRQESFSDPVEIKQDTVPLAPKGLELRSFDTLVLSIEGALGNTEFTVETYGVEATWEMPAIGKSECYHAEIEDNEGLKATPGRQGEISKGDQLRKFINLTPGKTYRITVYSGTCGDGHLGELRSDGISANIRLPPGTPPVIAVQEETSTAELTWDAPEGSYSDFEIVQMDNQSSRINMEEPGSSTDLGRNLTGLRPCTTYQLDVYTILDGQRSLSPRRVEFNTKPVTPSRVTVTDFSETSVTIRWDGPIDEVLQDYLIRISSDFENVLRTNENVITLSNLDPGTQYSMGLQSICREFAEDVTSIPTTFTQTTKPNPPRLTSSECTYIGANEAISSAYESVPWSAPDPSRITLVWEKPIRGTWDGFLVDYSPYDFEEGDSSPIAPQSLNADQTSTIIRIPVSGRVMSLSIRTLSNGVYSDPAVRRITCGDRNGEAVLKCRSYLFFWNIIISPVEDGRRLLVELPYYPIFNATAFLDDFDEVLLFFNNTFVIRNPCEDGPSSKITVYPQCPSIIPYCPVISRPICTARKRGRFEEFDSCCNSRLYKSKDEICCHSKLMKKAARTTEECCATKWYDSTTHKCCGNGRTTLRSLLDGSC